MSREFVVTETTLVGDRYTEVAHHVVPVKLPTESGFYREIRSWSAFMNAYYPNRRQGDGRWYYVRSREDHDIHESAWRNTLARSGLTPRKVRVVEHESVDHFYKHIGYDRKAKYIKE